MEKDFPEIGSAFLKITLEMSTCQHLHLSTRVIYVSICLQTLIKIDNTAFSLDFLPLSSLSRDITLPQDVRHPLWPTQLSVSVGTFAPLCALYLAAFYSFDEHSAPSRLQAPRNQIKIQFQGCIDKESAFREEDAGLLSAGFCGKRFNPSWICRTVKFDKKDTWLIKWRCAVAALSLSANMKSFSCFKTASLEASGWLNTAMQSGWQPPLQRSQRKKTHERVKETIDRVSLYWAGKFAERLQSMLRFWTLLLTSRDI